jgi:SAM-dependent methyltransferase
MPDVRARLQDADHPASVADIGCGFGWAAIELAKGHPHVHVDGFDLDEQSIAEAPGRSHDVRRPGRWLVVLRQVMSWALTHAASVDEFDRDPDEVVAIGREPRTQRELLDPAHLVRIGYLLGISDNHHRPAGPRLGIELVDLEGDDRVAGGAGQLRAVSGADEHCVVVEQERHRLDGRKRLVGVGDASHRYRSE